MCAFRSLTSKVPGGYFVSHHEKELKYVLAFKEPQVSLIYYH